jgi:L-fuculose-phosphate aldolase
LITTKEGSVPIARKLGDKRALFIKNHGVVVVGRSLQEAVISALYLEIAAKAQVTAKAFGKLNPIEKQTALRMHDRQYQVKQFEQFWNYYARKFQKPS